MHTTEFGDTTPLKTIRIDDKGRVNIGKFVNEAVTSFKVFRDSEDRIILEPYMAEIPARELWSMAPEIKKHMDLSFKQYLAGELVEIDPDFFKD